jgi:hypothetical protein
MTHKGIDKHQKKVMKKMKSGLTTTDVLFHVDFAENYATKYATEIQSIHFGGNQNQVTLHTAVNILFQK